MSEHSDWTHAICETCYYAVRPDGVPVRMVASERRTETCCACGNDSDSGIYVREEPVLFSFCAHDRVSW